MVGPGVRNLGITNPADFFSDHADLRPTILMLLGLEDDHQYDGRAILEMLDPNILPGSLHAHSETLLRLGQLYKQINAPRLARTKHADRIHVRDPELFRRRRGFQQP